MRAYKAYNCMLLIIVELKQLLVNGSLSAELPTSLCSHQSSTLQLYTEWHGYIQKHLCICVLSPRVC